MVYISSVLRSVDISLKFCTERKRCALGALVREYRNDVNFFIKSLWKTPGKLDAETLARRANSRLTARYKSKALKQALDIVISTRKALKVKKKYGKVPVFSGAPLLDAKFVTIDLSQPSSSFDIFLKVSSLAPGRRITIPAKKTAPLNKWLALPGAVLRQGCALGKDKLTLFVDVPTPPKRTTGPRVGIDIGITDLMATSDGVLLNTGWTNVLEKLRRSRRGSKAYARHCNERTNVINRLVNQLDWASLSLVAVEDLTGLKTGKHPNRSRAFRRASSPWTYRRVLSRINDKCEENGVLQHEVSPRNTSRCCPVCGTVAAESRKGKTFCCVACGHTSDADTNGGVNILSRALHDLHLRANCREPGVPDATKPDC